MPAYFGISRTLTQYRQAPFQGAQLASLGNPVRSGLFIELIADNIVGSAGSSVATWPDSSGNGNSVTQPTSARQPVLQIGTGGRNTVEFNGILDALLATFSVVQPLTVFCVAKYLSTTTEQTLFDGGGLNLMRFFVGSDGVSASIFAGGQITITTTLTTAHLYTCIFNGVSSSLAADSTTPTTGNAGTATPVGISVGALANSSEASNVQISALIGYTSISPTDISNVQAWLRSHYATP